MGYKPERWPYKALGTLEDTLSILKDIERASGAAQKAVIDGDKLVGVMVMGDIRTKAMMAHSMLVGAKAGEYD